MKRTTIALICLTLTASAGFEASAQNEMIASQFVHNQYAINPAFGGSREGLTVFGSFRRQWAGISGSPQSLLLTAHTPLKNQQLTTGLSVYRQSIHVSDNTGVQASVGYRFRIGSGTWMALALLPGVSIRSSNWTDTDLMEGDDPVFAENESNATPLAGFGISVYAADFFAGFSVPTLMVADDFGRRDAEFAPDQATYILTGGYLWQADERVHLQPSVMARYDKRDDLVANVNLDVIYRRMFWLGASWQTTGDIIATVACQALPQLRVAYSYGYCAGDLKGFNSGTHEVSVQYDFVYPKRVQSPRFY